MNVVARSSQLARKGLFVGLCSLLLGATQSCAEYLDPKESPDVSNASGPQSGEASKDKPDASEKSEAPGSQDKPKTFKPSKKSVYFKLDGKIPKSNLRIMVKPELQLTMDNAKAAGPLIDIKAKFKSKRVKVKIPPLGEDVQLGFAKFAILLVTLYVDEDESKDYSKGDQIIATAVNAPIYARNGNAPRVGEWSRLDLETNEMVPIEGSIPLARVDDIEPVQELIFYSREVEMAKKINLAATLGILEHRNFPKELKEAPRPILEPIDPKSPLYEFKISEALDEDRLFDEDENPPLVGVKRFGFELIAGIQSKSEALDEESELIGLGCIRRTQGPVVVYDPVALLWIEPGKDWLRSPLGAFLIMRNNFKPGWNAAIARETGPDQYTIAALPEQDQAALGFYRDCRFTPRPSYVLKNSFFGVPRAAH